MFVTKDLEEFYRKNDDEIRAYIVSRIHFYDKEILNDLTQSVYLDMKKNDTLNKFNPTKGTSFSTYIFQVVSWRLRQDAVANKKIDLSQMITETSNLQETLDDYINFLQNTGVSCTGLYEITESLRMRLEDGKTTKELPQSYYKSHRDGLKNYRLYNEYSLYGITGVCNII